MARLILVIAVSLACACAPEPVPSRASLGEGARVEIVRATSTPPESADGPPLVDVRVVDGRGRSRVVGPVVGGVAWADGVLSLDAERELSLETANGERTSLDTHVSFVPVVAPDGRRFVYARSEDGFSFALVERTSEEARVLAEGLASIGGVRFLDADRFVMIAGRPGGIAGLWLASSSSGDRASCLTNCALRTGTPWGDAFVPLPGDLESLALEGDVISYEDPDGALHQVSITGGAR